MTRTFTISVGAAVLGMCAVATATAFGGHHAPTPAAPRTLVLAELFTSEGCSSCPPADALVRRLLSEQPVEGVEVVALGLHVDYWDRLGWRDPFSSPDYSARQSAYAAGVFGADRIYTPQLVVDGTFESVGSDAAAVRRNLLAAAKAPKATLVVGVTPESALTVRVNVEGLIPATITRADTATLMLAVVEDGLETRVQRGENGGRTLAHSAVVRSLQQVGTVKPDQRAAAASAQIHLDAAWSREHVRIVVFLQEQPSRRILGIGTAGTTSAR